MALLLSGEEESGEIAACWKPYQRAVDKVFRNVVDRLRLAWFRFGRDDSNDSDPGLQVPRFSRGTRNFRGTLSLPASWWPEATRSAPPLTAAKFIVPRRIKDCSG
jgi:hypothetical protein